MYVKLENKNINKLIMYIKYSIMYITAKQIPHCILHGFIKSDHDIINIQKLETKN